MDFGSMESDDNVSNEVRHKGICKSLWHTTVYFSGSCCLALPLFPVDCIQQLLEWSRRNFKPEIRFHPRYRLSQRKMWRFRLVYALSVLKKIKIFEGAITVIIWPPLFWY